MASVGFAAAATAAAAAGVALAVMGKKAIDAADDLSKTAQKAGVTTEALSRLKYAADFSDVSLEQLSGGLQKLSRNMADIASGKGGSAATAFSALGIGITEASGQLRDADEVFAQIADKFSRLEDGSTKTALAIQLFGRAGADLIPLLNGGSASLAAMANESDRLGLTVSTKTGRAAEQFNDTLTKIGRIIDGVVLRISTAALPALQRLADALSSTAFQQAAQSFGTAMVGAFTDVINWIGQVETRWGQFLKFVATQGRPQVLPLGSQNIEDRSTPGWMERNQQAGAVVDGSFAALGNGQMFGTTADMWKGLAGSSMPTFSDGGATQALATRLEALRQSLMTEEQLEIDSHAKRLEEIQKFYEDGAIKKGEYDSMILTAQQQHADAMTEIAKRQVEEETRMREQLVSNVAGIFGSLSTIAESFGEKGLAASKAFGVAEAIVNTAQGITKALAQGGIFGFVGAAAVAAAGAAQIATILSASKGSSTKPSVKGGSSTAAPAVATPVADAGGTTVNLTLQGGGRYSRNELEALFRDMNDAMGDGLKLNVVSS